MAQSADDGDRGETAVCIYTNAAVRADIVFVPAVGGAGRSLSGNLFGIVAAVSCLAGVVPGLVGRGGDDGVRVGSAFRSAANGVQAVVCFFVVGAIAEIAVVAPAQIADEAAGNIIGSRNFSGSVAVANRGRIILYGAGKAACTGIRAV